MSSFFTTPASQRKRKRPSDAAPSDSIKRRSTTGPGRGGASARARGRAQPLIPSRKERDNDEEISGSDSGSDGVRRRRMEDAGTDDDGDSSDSADEDETAAEKRLRLAERYLEELKGEVEEDVGFDARDIDRDLIAERLKEDVAETKGRMYRHIALELDLPAATCAVFRANTQSITSIALHPPFVYTSSKNNLLQKWELRTPPPSSTATPDEHPPTKTSRAPHAAPRQPKLLLTHRHLSPILTLAISPAGTHLASGAMNNHLTIHSPTTLLPTKTFPQHRSPVTSLAFRRNTNQLYSSSADRTIKLWSLDELAYVETLFGHQDSILDVAALAEERCISVGGRDRTARLWKVVEETQLVFRGGGLPSTRHRGGEDGPDRKPRQAVHAEGSIDRVAIIDEETFITGSDNGSLCLWTMHKKKPIFTVPLAHGLAPAPTASEASAEQHPSEGVGGEPQPRWITALAAVPYADLLLSGSWDGTVRVWRVTPDKRRIESVGVLDGAKGVVNDLAVYARGDDHRCEGLCVVAGTGKEHRLGRWIKIAGGRNAGVVWEIPVLPKESKPGDDTVVIAEVAPETNGAVKESPLGEGV